MKIGVDIGGSHISVGIIEEGKIISKKEILINKEWADIDMKLAIVESIRQLSISLLSELDKKDVDGITEIGIAAPGKIVDGVIYDMYNLGINKFEIKDMLKAKFPGMKIKVINDGTAAGIAEFKYGSLKKYDDAVFLCVGTGIGGATFIKGKLLEPKSFAGSEYGHMIIENNGRDCNCGNKGCFEKYASMSALREGLKKYVYLGDDASTEKILEALKANEKDLDLEKYIDSYLDYLIIGIKNIANIIAPEAICLGGGFAGLEEVLMPKIEEKVKDKSFVAFTKPKIVIAELGNDAGILGV